MSAENEMMRYRKLLRTRKILYIGFTPAAIFVLWLAGGGIPGLPGPLAWVFVLFFAVGCVVLMQRIDVCPWCSKSFHSKWTGNDEITGFASLVRKRCANCSEPRSASATKPASSS